MVLYEKEQSLGPELSAYLEYDSLSLFVFRQAKFFKVKNNNGSLEKKTV